MVRGVEIFENEGLSLSCREWVTNLSSMRLRVLSPDETLRKELKIRRAAEYF